MSARDSIALIWSEIAQEYTARGTQNQFSFIGLETFTDPLSPNKDAPFLSGKGAMTRHLVPILASIFMRHHWSAHFQERLILKAIGALQRIYELFDWKDAAGTFPFRLPGNVNEELVTSTRAFLNYVQLLRTHFEG